MITSTGSSVPVAMKKDDVGPHTWNSGTVTTAPTCTKAGEKTYSCNKCDATKIEPIPATGHSWKSDWTSDATHHWHECTNKNCDVTDNAGKKGYAEHSGGKATCTQNAVCEFCKAEYGEKLPHDFTAESVDAKVPEIRRHLHGKGSLLQVLRSLWSELRGHGG